MQTICGMRFRQKHKKCIVCMTLGQTSAMSRSSKKIYTALQTLLGERPGSVLSREEANYKEYLKANSPGAEELKQQSKQEESLKMELG